MALFLSEAASAFYGSDSSSVQSFADAYREMLTLSEEYHTFNESVLVADYILEKQSVNLSEGEMFDKAKHFGKRVWEGLVQIGRKVWAKVKDIARFVMRKVSMWTTKVLSLFGDSTKISKSLYYEMNEAPRLIERMIAFAETGWITASGQAGSGAAFTKEIAEYHAAVAKQGSDQTDVKKAVLKKAADQIQALAKKLEEACTKQAAYFEGKASKEGATDEAKEVATQAKEAIAAIQKAAGEVTGVASRLTAAHAAATAEKGKEGAAAPAAGTQA